MIFIFPHTLVRVLSFSLIAAFMKYYSAIPAAILLTTNSTIALVTSRMNKDDDCDTLYVAVLSGLCVPFVGVPKSVSQQRYMSRSLLSTNILIFIGLIFLLFFPLITPPHLINVSASNLTGKNFI